MDRRTTVALSVFALAALGCAEGGTGPKDAGVRGDSTVRDSGRRDTGIRDSGPRDTGPRDSGPRDAGGGDAGGRTDAAPPTDAGPGCALEAGSVAIVEAMVSSRSGSGDLGEWFEVVSTAPCALDLTGMVIVSPDGGGTEQSHTVGALTLMPGARLVFAQSGNAMENHLLPHDYVYGSTIVLDNASDWIELRVGADVVDRVAWPSGGFSHGRARQFPQGGDVGSNANWSLWCDATDRYSDAGGTFYGTPQMPNIPCP